MKKIIKKIAFPIFLIVIFFTIVAIWYSPVVFKGYPAESMGSEIVLARNYAEHGIYGLENDLNIAVEPDLVSQQANISSLGNKFSALSYAVIFKIFGWQSWDNLLIIAAMILALACIIFTATTYHLFGLQTAIIFPFVFVLLPFNWQVAQFLGQYEFAILYFSLFVFFYFWGRDQKIKYLYLILAGLFLGLACLAREAFFLFLPVFFFWLLYMRKRKELFLSFIPVGILLIIFWLPAILGISGQNNYVTLFSSAASTEHVDLHFYGHIYPDPYTYHFQPQVVKNQLEYEINANELGMFYIIGRMKVGMNMGLIKIGIVERIIVGTSILSRHISKYFAVEYIGGPLIFLLSMLGLWELKNRERKLFLLFFYWLIVITVLLSYVVLAIRSHLMDFGWMIALLVSLALVSLLPMLQNYFNLGKYSKPVFIFIILITLYSLVLANHVYWGRAYDNSKNLELKYFAQEVNKLEININDVIATGERAAHPTLNYLTSKSIVFFDPMTVTKLIEENNLQQAFDKFNIRYIVGYSDVLSEDIIKNSQVINVSSWPEKGVIEAPISYNKMWLLNLVK